MGVKLSDRYDIYSFTAASGAIAETIIPKGGEFRLAGYTIHADLALAAEAITFTLDAVDGAAYDVVLLSDTTLAATDDHYMIKSDERVPLKQGDEIDIAYANTNNRTYGLKVFIERE